MASLGKELEELHAAVVHAVRERLENGGVDMEGNPVPVSNDDLRVAMQLLKQNNVTANLAEANDQRLKSMMAGKLNFSGLKEKVIPLRESIQPPAA